MSPINEATRMNSVPFSGIRRIFNEAMRLEQSGRNIIHLEIGRPDFDTPVHIKHAAELALDRGDVHYTANAGTAPRHRALTGFMGRTISHWAKAIWTSRAFSITCNRQTLQGRLFLH